VLLPDPEAAIISGKNSTSSARKPSTAGPHKNPQATPNKPPVAESTTVSMRNCWMMSPWLAPSARRTPISRVRSVTVAYIRAICKDRQFDKVADITADGVNGYAGWLKDQGRSTRTVQAYLTAIKGFTKWLAAN